MYEGSPPTSISSLLHWRTMMSLLHLLNNEEREDFRGYACPMNRDGLPLSTPRATDHSLEFIDTHMHLDLSLQNLRLSSFKQLEEQTKSGTLNVIKVITNYVFPSSWNDSQIHTDNDKQNRVAVTFGIHPHAAPKHLNKIDELRTHEWADLLFDEPTRKRLTIRDERQAVVRRRQNSPGRASSSASASSLMGFANVDIRYYHPDGTPRDPSRQAMKAFVPVKKEIPETVPSTATTSAASTTVSTPAESTDSVHEQTRIDWNTLMEQDSAVPVGMFPASELQSRLE